SPTFTRSAAWPAPIRQLCRIQSIGLTEPSSWYSLVLDQLPATIEKESSCRSVICRCRVIASRHRSCGRLGASARSRLAVASATSSCRKYSVPSSSLITRQYTNICSLCQARYHQTAVIGGSLFLPARVRRFIPASHWLRRLCEEDTELTAGQTLVGDDELRIL